MKTIEQADFKGKKVLVRCDFNVPLKNGTITDDTRIRESMPTVRKLLQDGAAVILMSHLGRPAGTGFEAEFSLAPVAKHLEKTLERPVVFPGDAFTQATVDAAKALQPGQVMLLENLRFIKGETKGDEEFARYLASLGDAYVNDAFGAAHRSHSSTAVIAKFFPESKYFGLLMAHEITNLEKLLNHAEHPFTAVIGGAKVSSKIDVIKNLVDKVDNMLIGGGMAYTFAKAMGGKIGNSLVEDDKMETALEIIRIFKEKGKRLLLPSDTLCADKFDNDAERKVMPTGEIADGWMGMDIGPDTIAEYEKAIAGSRSVLWNGPLGVFEMENFSQGTLQIGRCIGKVTENGGYTAVGGGDSVAAVNRLGLAKNISYVSTGGGAMLEYLEGKELPGVKAILI
ncbi:MAG: phosphoglycerate kinase [Bacteroides sp.]|nr:phosphoglycerate kinase [Ruminococcus flavefaciens]MCM1554774.1 phosphoglycerate kinase [Bacteroides sp.]